MFNAMLKELRNEAYAYETKINTKLDKILERLHKMSIELDNLTAQVKANSDLLDSATTLINGIADRITAAGVDPAKLKALTDELKAKDDVLAAAVVANTPAPAA
jgi:predicted  nucleic acid-binding Zn-ribbon protein